MTVADEDVFAAVVRQAFAQRRKTLRNTLRGLLDADEIRLAGIDPALRAEKLDLEAFAALADQATRQRIDH